MLAFMLAAAVAGTAMAAPSCSKPPGCALPLGWGVKRGDYDFAVNFLQNRIDYLRGIVRSDDNLPFLMLHGKKTPKVAVLIHGLGDSPCSMRAIGEVLFQQGYNVVSVLLDGNGTKPEDLRGVTHQEWKRTVSDTVEVAAALGDRLTLVGFSTGGALALSELADTAWDRGQMRRAARHGGTYFTPLHIDELILFSPALNIGSSVARALCANPKIADGVSSVWRFVPSPVGAGSCKYSMISTHAACQVDALARENQAQMPAILDDIAASGIRTFLAFWEGDHVVSVLDLQRFGAALPPEATQIESLPDWQRPPLGHNLAKALPQLPLLRKELKQFAELGPRQ